MEVKPGLAYRIYHLFWSGLDLVFPPTCGGCGQLGDRWCIKCQTKTEPIPEPICEICGEPENRSGICSRCETSRPAFDKLRSWVVFNGPIRTVLHKLKYRRDIGLGEALAIPLAEFLDKLGWRIDLVVPIPLSRQRLSERGYNQVGLISLPLALARDLRYEPRAISRVRYTRSQVGLSALERQENVHGAFRALSNIVTGKIVLLVDDVATTGATLSSGAQALIDAGAQKVYAFTVAKALSRYGLDHV